MRQKWFKSICSVPGTSRSTCLARSCDTNSHTCLSGRLAIFYSVLLTTWYPKCHLQAIFFSSHWGSCGKLAAPAQIGELSCDGEGGCAPGVAVTALSCHLLFFISNHEHLWPFKAGSLVIISPDAFSTKHVLFVGFLLDKWYIFYIKMGNNMHLSQPNMFLNTGCMRLSSLLGVCVPWVSMAFLVLGHLGVLGVAPAAGFVESRTPSSELLLDIWGTGGCVQLQTNVCTRRAINFRLSCH